MLDKRSPVTGEQCGTGNMLTGRSIKPGAGSVSKKQLCHSGGKSATWFGEGNWFLAGCQDHIPTDTGVCLLHETERQRDRNLNEGHGPHARVHGHSLCWERTHSHTQHIALRAFRKTDDTHKCAFTKQRERERRKRERG